MGMTIPGAGGIYVARTWGQFIAFASAVENYGKCVRLERKEYLTDANVDIYPVRVLGNNAIIKYGGGFNIGTKTLDSDEDKFKNIMSWEDLSFEADVASISLLDGLWSVPTSHVRAFHTIYSNVMFHGDMRILGTISTGVNNEYAKTTLQDCYIGSINNKHLKLYPEFGKWIIRNITIDDLREDFIIPTNVATIDLDGIIVREGRAYILNNTMPIQATLHDILFQQRCEAIVKNTHADARILAHKIFLNTGVYLQNSAIRNANGYMTVDDLFIDGSFTVAKIIVAERNFTLSNSRIAADIDNAGNIGVIETYTGENNRFVHNQLILPTDSADRMMIRQASANRANFYLQNNCQSLYPEHNNLHIRVDDADGAKAICEYNSGIVVNDKTRFASYEANTPFVEDIEGGGGGGSDGVKYQYTPGNNTAQYSGYCVRTILADNSYMFSFVVPDDFGELVSLQLLCILTSQVCAANKNIDFDSHYGKHGEHMATHDEEDITTVYDLSGRIGQHYSFDISGVFTALGADDRCGLNVTHNNIGGSIHYLGILLEYIPS